MIKSMTGFGRCELEENDRKISVEIKSVNHRFLEPGIKLPKALSMFDGRIRELIKQYASRGKLDIFINYVDQSEKKTVLKYNKDVADEYYAILNQIKSDFELIDDISVRTIASFPDVITAKEVELDEDELWSFISKAISTALEELVQVRSKEGLNLKNDIIDKLDTMSENVAFIEKRSPEIMADYRNKLESKVQELLGARPIDEARIATEVVIYADKICVDEETVRLKSHIKQAKAALEEEGGVGRKLDFIAQEMNREANTILSKADDIEISTRAIALKTDIEKVREQIQNIE